MAKRKAKPIMVECVIAFSGFAGKRPYNKAIGDRFLLPDGVDWLKAGFVIPVTEEREKAVSAKGEAR